MGKKWDALWKHFDDLMDLLPGAIEEVSISDDIPGMLVMKSANGDVTIRGRIKSLRINGYEVRVPAHVMQGNK